MGAAPVVKLSVEEYLALDRASETKGEYHDGEVFPCEAVSIRHAKINDNIAFSLRLRLDKTPCMPLGSNLRVRVSPTKYLLPDLMVVCGKPALTDAYEDSLTNPKVIIEILSHSTENYDYGRKFGLYRLLPSFEEYVLISQDSPRIETFRKTSDTRWQLTTFEGTGTEVAIESLGLCIPLSEIYSGLDLL